MTKAEARKKFRGSTALFNACWKQYLRDSDDTDINDVMDYLDELASSRVNNSASRFYIYG